MIIKTDITLKNNAEIQELLKDGGKMEKKIIQNLKDKLFKKYADFQKENIFIDNEEDFISIYGYSYSNLSEKKILMLKKFINNFLLKHKQEGFFYICDYNFKVKEELRE